MRAALMAVSIGLALLALAAAPAIAKGRSGYTAGVANSALVSAAKATPLKRIDYGEDYCRNDRTVAQWLDELTAGDARKIVWTGGPCQLVDTINPIDSGSAWCAQATIVLKHPRDRHDRPMVEIFFDKPTHGRPGPAYAFRGFIDGDGLLRFRNDFENSWLERFPANTRTIVCPDDR